MTGSPKFSGGHYHVSEEKSEVLLVTRKIRCYTSMRRCLAVPRREDPGRVAGPGQASRVRGYSTRVRTRVIKVTSPEDSFTALQIPARAQTICPSYMLSSDLNIFFQRLHSLLTRETSSKLKKNKVKADVFPLHFFIRYH